ncbi:MAG: hypothetical protein N2112_13630 [Gemmataceae bacterium]|jgi:hypothetical protein|nr:hypothetical protein [Gemmataceae bacterium]
MRRRSPEEWRDWVAEFSQGQYTEAWRGIMCFLRWVQIRTDNGYPVPTNYEALEGDLYHSHLLRRMLAGKDPLLNPPPESFGYPWYELAEQGHAEPTEVRPWEYAEDKLLINQAVWNIIEKKSDNEYILSYKADPTYYLLKKNDDKWRIIRLQRPV